MLEWATHWKLQRRRTPSTVRISLVCNRCARTARKSCSFQSKPTDKLHPRNCLRIYLPRDRCCRWRAPRIKTVSILMPIIYIPSLLHSIFYFHSYDEWYFSKIAYELMFHCWFGRESGSNIQNVQLTMPEMARATWTGLPRSDALSPDISKRSWAAGRVTSANCP